MSQEDAFALRLGGLVMVQIEFPSFSNSLVEVLTPDTTDCELTWEYSHCRFN